MEGIETWVELPIDRWPKHWVGKYTPSCATSHCFVRSPRFGGIMGNSLRKDAHNCGVHHAWPGRVAVSVLSSWIEAPPGRVCRWLQNVRCQRVNVERMGVSWIQNRHGCPQWHWSISRMWSCARTASEAYCSWPPFRPSLWQVPSWSPRQEAAAAERTQDFGKLMHQKESTSDITVNQERDIMFQTKKLLMHVTWQVLGLLTLCKAHRKMMPFQNGTSTLMKRGAMHRGREDLQCG